MSKARDGSIVEKIVPDNEKSDDERAALLRAKELRACKIPLGERIRQTEECLLKWLNPAFVSKLSKEDRKNKKNRIKFLKEKLANLRGQCLSHSGKEQSQVNKTKKKAKPLSGSRSGKKSNGPRPLTSIFSP